MDKYEDVLGRLTEDEKLAFEILQKNGWLTFVEVSVDCAITENMRFPTYSVGGRYDLGILKSQVPVRSEKVAPARKKKKD
jgi:hypothetical protein